MISPATIALKASVARPRKCPGADRGHGEAVDDERSGVVGQALALEDKEEALGSLSRRAIASGATASGGETIAPSRKSTGQGTDRDELCGDGDRDGREDDAPKRKQGHWAQIESNSRQLIETADE